MTTSAKIAIGIVGAAAAGVLIGLLIAPDKGSETRKKIGNSTASWVDTVGKLFTKAKHSGERALKNVKA